MNFFRYFVVTLAVLAMMGCATPESRIRQNPQLFASFPPDVQEKIRQGHIALGFSQDAVQMALGDPDRVFQRITTNHVADVWSYNSYDYRTDPQFITILSPVSDIRGLGVITPPNVIMVDVQHRVEYEALRVEFEGDKVKAIEAVKR